MAIEDHDLSWVKEVAEEQGLELPAGDERCALGCYGLGWQWTAATLTAPPQAPAWWGCDCDHTGLDDPLKTSQRRPKPGKPPMLVRTPG
jgi:hypothetical protein